MDGVRMLAAGECGVVVEFGDSIDPAVNDRVHGFFRRVSESNVVGVVEVVPTYRSALVVFDPLVIGRAKLENYLREMMDEPDAAREEIGPARVVTIPVCYGGEFGPDLGFVASHNGISEDEVIRIHCSRPMRIYMLGFMPGFPYLGGMDERIATPRLPKPRVKIPAGSVGIAGSQTGFYPYEAPGGWRLIGRTAVRPFNPGAAEPFLFSAGDYLKFRPVDIEEFDQIRSDVEAGRYRPEIGGAP